MAVIKHLLDQMKEKNIGFIVSLNGVSPRNLKDSIRQVQNASAGFKQSWLNKNYEEASETSQEAFVHLDYIQNELLRQRDALKKDQATWHTSQLRKALGKVVGELLNDVSSDDRDWFKRRPQGQGAMPSGYTPVKLTLEPALNKLKHRDTVAINFSLTVTGKHILYLFTEAGMGQPNSVSMIDISEFCSACKCAAEHV